MNTLTSSLQVRTFPPLLLSSPLYPCQSLRLNPLHPRPWLRATLLASRWHLCRSRLFTRCTSSSCTLCSCRLRGWRGILLDATFFSFLETLSCFFFAFLFFSGYLSTATVYVLTHPSLSYPFNLLFTFDKKTTPSICAGLLTFLHTTYLLLITPLFFALGCVFLSYVVLLYILVFSS